MKNKSLACRRGLVILRIPQVSRTIPMSPRPLLAARVALALGSFAAALPAQATNGYFAHGYSASQRALGGAGTALAEDALAITINPAASAWAGSRWDFNLSLFNPVRGYESGPVGGGGTGFGILAVAPDDKTSGREFFGIPGFGWVAPLDERFSAGVAIYGNGGMNTSYKDGQASFAKAFSGNPLLGTLVSSAPTESRCQGTFGGGPAAPGGGDLLGFCGKGRSTTSVDLIQLFVAPNLSWRVNDGFAVGVSPLFVGQRFAATGLQSFARFSNSPRHVSDQGYSFSFGGGGRVGALWQAAPWLDLGGSWQSRISMSRFKEYEGLFAGRGDFDIPSTWNLGLALKPAVNHRILFDYQRINFSEIDAVGLPLDANSFVNNCAVPRLLGSTGASAACLGSDTGPGFGWRDITVRKFGYQISQGDWTWRLGYSRTRQPIPESEVLFNILAPGVIAEHYTAGVNWRYDPRLALDLGVMYAPPNPVVGRNPLSNVQVASAGQAINAAPDAGDQRIVLDMRQYELTMGLSYRY